MKNKQKKLFIIDGMAMIYRSHFAMIKNPLTTKNGQHTSAIYGLANSILKFAFGKASRTVPSTSIESFLAILHR